MAMSDLMRGKSANLKNDASKRSVYISNLSFEASEDSLRKIFEQVGPIVSFRVAFNKDRASTQIYAICEYYDPEIAKSAVRNLNNFDYCGRPLQVDPIPNEASNHSEDPRAKKEHSHNVSQESGETPETISRAVASLPPEQMFELMKQMKICIQNDPNEARNMLLQNPQLAYALLQAQIVMKIVDPQVAIAILHRETEHIPPALNNTATYSSSNIARGSQMSVDHPTGQASNKSWQTKNTSVKIEKPVQPMMTSNRDPRRMAASSDPRSSDPRSAVSSDPRPTVSSNRRSATSIDPRSNSVIDPRANLPGDPRSSAVAGDPRSALSGDPRSRAAAPQPLRQDFPPQEDEKTAVLMQVLQLSEEQIAMLPAEQRQSIQILREQIARSSNPS